MNWCIYLHPELDDISALFMWWGLLLTKGEKGTGWLTRILFVVMCNGAFIRPFISYALPIIWWNYMWLPRIPQEQDWQGACLLGMRDGGMAEKDVESDWEMGTPLKANLFNDLAWLMRSRPLAQTRLQVAASEAAEVQQIHPHTQYTKRWWFIWYSHLLRFPDNHHHQRHSEEATQQKKNLANSTPTHQKREPIWMRAKGGPITPFLARPQRINGTEQFCLKLHAGQPKVS